MKHIKRRHVQYVLPAKHYTQNTRRNFIVAHPSLEFQIFICHGPINYILSLTGYKKGDHKSVVNQENKNIIDIGSSRNT
jgi:hypothetical protein